MKGRRCAVAKTAGRNSDNRCAVDCPLGVVALTPEACTVRSFGKMAPALDMGRLGSQLRLSSAAAEFKVGDHAELCRLQQTSAFDN